MSSRFSSVRQNGVFNWTKPHYGVTHCGSARAGQCWATVNGFDNGKATLECFDWRKFDNPCLWSNTETQWFDTVALAKEAGEKWLESIYPA